MYAALESREEVCDANTPYLLVCSTWRSSNKVAVNQNTATRKADYPTCVCGWKVTEEGTLRVQQPHSNYTDTVLCLNRQYCFLEVKYLRSTGIIITCCASNAIASGRNGAQNIKQIELLWQEINNSSHVWPVTANATNINKDIYRVIEKERSVFWSWWEKKVSYDDEYYSEWLL